MIELVIAMFGFNFIFDLNCKKTKNTVVLKLILKVKYLKLFFQKKFDATSIFFLQSETSKKN